MMNRRGFLGALTALAVAPFVPVPTAQPEWTPVTIDQIHGVDLAWEEMPALTRGDIITIEGFAGQFVVTEDVHLPSLTVTVAPWAPGLDHTRVPLELVTPVLMGRTVYDSRNDPGFRFEEDGASSRSTVFWRSRSSRFSHSRSPSGRT